ncbi:hypothetical protein [Hyphomonas sp.]|uniref:hypothetical protein n=1 Tax=Hyphomonas sp. TaxID=87 RepID=UPI0025BBD3D8|nr:hypothetical protein [Hyphomonas sp.]MBI1401469.1 hypothetical protein [Hyphomonas sp.]
MSETDSEKKPLGPPSDSLMWGRFIAILTIAGGAFAWFAANYEAIKPALESPAFLIVVMVSTYGLGGASAYWVVARPLEKRLNAAERVINGLRLDDRATRDKVADLKVTVARLETQLALMTQSSAGAPADLNKGNA